MKHIIQLIIACVFLLATLPVMAVKPPDIKVNKEDAKAIAVSTYTKKGELSAMEQASEPVLVQIGFPVKGFAGEGEWVWEVRISNRVGALRAIIWVHTRTGKTHNIAGK